MLRNVLSRVYVRHRLEYMMGLVTDETLSKNIVHNHKVSWYHTLDKWQVHVHPGVTFHWKNIETYLYRKLLLSLLEFPNNIETICIRGQHQSHEAVCRPFLFQWYGQPAISINNCLIIFNSRSISDGMAVTISLPWLLLLPNKQRHFGAGDGGLYHNGKSVVYYQGSKVTPPQRTRLITSLRKNLFRRASWHLSWLKHCANKTKGDPHGKGLFEIWCQTNPPPWVPCQQCMVKVKIHEKSS